MLRRTLFWLAGLLLLVAGAAGGTAWWVWSNQDDLLKGEIEKQLAKNLPGWNVEFDSASFDWDRVITLRNVQITIPGDERPFARVPEILVFVDREQMRDHQRPLIRKIIARKPVLTLERAADGKWNWQRLPKPPPGGNGLIPEWSITDATLQLTIHHKSTSRPARVAIRGANARLVPSAHKRYAISAAAPFDGTGELKVAGQWDLRRKSWFVDGKMNDVRAAEGLVNLAGKASPKFTRSLENFEKPSAIRTIGDTAFVDAPRPDEGFSTLGIAGTFGVRFRYAKWNPKAKAEFKLAVSVKEGRIDNPLLPFPLRDVFGQIYWDNHRLILHQISASNGKTTLNLGASFSRPVKPIPNGGMPGSVKLDVKQLPIDQRLIDRLPGNLQKLVAQLQLRGTIDASGTVTVRENKTWASDDLSVTLRDGSAQPTWFALPVSKVNGTVTQRGNKLTLSASASLSRNRIVVPISFGGTVVNPGPGAAYDLVLQTKSLPIDDSLFEAMPASLRKTMKSLKLTGEATGTYRLVRQTGTKKWQHSLQAALAKGTIQPEVFDYQFTNVSGDVDFRSDTGLCTFSKLSARRGKAVLTGNGSYQQSTKKLQLNLGATNLPIDNSLRSALPARLQKVWGDLAISGIAKSVATKIAWQPEKPVSVKIPTAEIIEGKLHAKAFSFPLQNITATVSYLDDKVTISKFRGSQLRTRVSGSGFYLTKPNGDWQFRVDKLYVDDLVTDRLFRSALPKSIREAVESLNPRGKPISFSGRVEFKGTKSPQFPLTAAWDLDFVLSGVALTTGVELTNVHGGVSCKGTWDGKQAKIDGAVDLKSATALNHRFTTIKGPYEFRGKELIVGSRRILDPASRRRGEKVALSERLSARISAGIITLDAGVTFEDPAPVAGLRRPKSKAKYAIKSTIYRARLENYAREYLTGKKNLAGEVNGWIDLRGESGDLNSMTGKGQVQISPAALYELPVVLQTLRALTSLRVTDRTAFKYALGHFDIAKQQVNFRLIDLAGDALNLRGYGRVGFDGRLAVDLYTTMSRLSVRVPLIDSVLNRATAGWAGVLVRGTLQAPKVRMRPLKNLDDAVRQFMRNVPRLVTPQPFPR